MTAQDELDKDPQLAELIKVDPNLALMIAEARAYKPQPAQGPKHSEAIRQGFERARERWEAQEHELLFVLPDGTEVTGDVRDSGVCEVCAAKMITKRHTGRPRGYCSDACRQKAYRQRKRDDHHLRA
jgi:hypothetical protein